MFIAKDNVTADEKEKNKSMLSEIQYVDGR